MTEADRLALGRQRRLVYSNVANGVPMEKIMAAYRLSQKEIEDIVRFVGRKINEYRFRRCNDAHDPRVAKQAAPPVPCETPADARRHRLAVLDTLSKLGPLYLSSELLLPTVKIAMVDHPAQLQDIKHRMRS